MLFCQSGYYHLLQIAVSGTVAVVYFMAGPRVYTHGIGLMVEKLECLLIQFEYHVFMLTCFQRYALESLQCLDRSVCIACFVDINLYHLRTVVVAGIADG